MADTIRTITVESRDAVELFISASPRPGQPLEAEANRIFKAIRDRLNQTRGARVFQERFFGTEEVMAPLRAIRSQCYGSIDDGVVPSQLVCSPSPLSGPWAGVQVHAIATDTETKVLREPSGTPCGHLVKTGSARCMGLSGISVPGAGDAPQQARAMFELSHTILQSEGASFFSVPRTWIWLREINTWYSLFNRARTGFFVDHGILGGTARPPMPASTGISLAPAGGAACAMDLVAVLEPNHAIEYLQAAGKQRSAFEYGSAFSRASRAMMPAGKTVFVSGTASIDIHGQSVHVDDAAAQIATTLDNVMAVLSDMDCSEADVVETMAYCKTPEAEAAFASVRDALKWPWVTMICDVCRPELLFEIEVMAMPRG